ncbi:unnamed protein product [Notodromas monacha]|uniref:Chitin-binding type-2 domain-containing protein n=1 Tax=Notodromas monacha TaxID=399045 RepID=A0A7R9BTW4_9CRUS|nr:unnamed protein product [Notodromas monacha]CAG0921653.1 unnamed protein product [Notodromas monacha]
MTFFRRTAAISGSFIEAALVYHHCLFGVRYDFLCANYTAFDQRTFICHFVSEVDCERSELYFSRNDELYKPASSSTTTTTTTTTQAPLPPPPQRQQHALDGGGGGGGGGRRRPLGGRGRRRRPFRRRRPQRPAYYDYDYYDRDYYDYDYYGGKQQSTTTTTTTTTEAPAAAPPQSAAVGGRRQRRPPTRRVAAAPPEEQAPLDPGARLAVFSRPRAAPKIRPPVPVSEKEKFDQIQGRDEVIQQPQAEEPLPPRLQQQSQQRQPQQQQQQADYYDYYYYDTTGESNNNNNKENSGVVEKPGTRIAADSRGTTQNVVEEETLPPPALEPIRSNQRQVSQPVQQQTFVTNERRPLRFRQRGGNLRGRNNRPPQINDISGSSDISGPGPALARDTIEPETTIPARTTTTTTTTTTQEPATTTTRRSRQRGLVRHRLERINPNNPPVEEEPQPQEQEESFIPDEPLIIEEEEIPEPIVIPEGRHSRPASPPPSQPEVRIRPRGSDFQFGGFRTATQRPIVAFDLDSLARAVGDTFEPAAQEPQPPALPQERQVSRVLQSRSRVDSAFVNRPPPPPAMATSSAEALFVKESELASMPLRLPNFTRGFSKAPSAAFSRQFARRSSAEETADIAPSRPLNSSIRRRFSRFHAVEEQPQGASSRVLMVSQA